MGVIRGNPMPYAWCLLMAIGTSAQDAAFEVLSKKALPDLGPSNAQAIIDVDGDGHLDVIAVNSAWPPGNYLLRNIGQRTIEARPVSSAAMTCMAVAVGDVDGDGKPDFVTGNWPVASDTGQTRLNINRGDLTFRDASAQMPRDAAYTGAVALGDVDGDKDLDLVIGRRVFQAASAQTGLYLNDGRGNFIDVTSSRLPVDADDTRALALGDVDGDGDIDIVIGNAAAGGRQANRVYVNDGKGAFSDGSARALGSLAEATNAVLLLDVDGDKDLDLVEANHSGAGQSRVRTNDGTGVFSAIGVLPAAQGRNPTAITAGDIDADGDADLVFGNLDREPDVFLNNGKGGFALGSATWMPPGHGGTTGVSLVDVDRDGDLDLLIGRSTEDRSTLYLNVEGTRFVDARSLLSPYSSRASVANVATGDVDGNGTIDAVLAKSSSSPQNELLLGDGTGRFTLVPGGLPPDADPSLAILLADVDGDGDPDVVVGNDGTRNRLHINDGAGRFTDRSVQLPAHIDSTRALVAGDVDGDRDLDLILGNRGQNRLYVNIGAGHFLDSPARLPVDNDATVALALVDVDGDKDLDLVMANGGIPYAGSKQQNKLYLNDGRGSFQDVTLTRLPSLVDATSAVSAGDVDRDGDLDLYFANQGDFTGPEQDRLYLNSGNGTFTDATVTHLPVDIQETTKVVLADVDQDGDLDVVACASNLMLYGYRNDGTGRFTKNLLRPVYASQGGGLAIADVDADGDLDLLLGATLFSALRRQIYSPTLAWLGSHYALDLYAGPSSANTMVALFLAPRATTGIPLPPWGQLFLDPTTTVGLGAISVAGRLQVGFTIPSVPALNGVMLHSQALVFHGPQPADWRLSNLQSDRILR